MGRVGVPQLPKSERAVGPEHGVGRAFLECGSSLDLVYNRALEKATHIPQDGLGCLDLIRQLDFVSAQTVEITKLHGAFSGALVLLAVLPRGGRFVAKGQI